MRLLLDQGLPRSSGLYIRKPETEVLHVGEVGLSTASDSKILDFARQQGIGRGHLGCGLPRYAGTFRSSQAVRCSRTDRRLAGPDACHFADQSIRDLR